LPSLDAIKPFLSDASGRGQAVQVADLRGRPGRPRPFALGFHQPASSKIVTSGARSICSMPPTPAYISWSAIDRSASIARWLGYGADEPARQTVKITLAVVQFMLRADFDAPGYVPPPPWAQADPD